jgi:hypothetical protein
MSKFLSRSIGALAFSAVCATSAGATTVPLGYVYWGVNIPGSVGNFNIQNNSGANSDPVDFPITTALSLSSLSLTVHFAGGGTTVFGSSYFTLGLDGFSFNGGDIGIGGANPLPTDATLTGSFSTTSVNITGLGAQTIAPNFSASILPSVGSTLSDFDFALINVEARTPGGTGGTAPEPSSLLLVGLACALALKWSTAKPAHGTGRTALN